MTNSPLIYIDKEELLSEDSLVRIQQRILYGRHEIKSLYSKQEYIDCIICMNYLRYESSGDVYTSLYLISEFIKKAVGYIEMPNSSVLFHTKYISEIISNEICKNFPDVPRSFIDPLYLEEMKNTYNYIITDKPFTRSISIVYIFIDD